MNSKYLVPSLVGGKDVPYSSNHFRKIKKELEEVTGIEFRLKDFRSTYRVKHIVQDDSITSKAVEYPYHELLRERHLDVRKTIL
jgi:hypothetical protein